MDFNSPINDPEDAYKRAPVTVFVTIPSEIIEQARMYPAIDWNEVIQRAADAEQLRHRSNFEVFDG
jgi:hypothetical protein